MMRKKKKKFSLRKWLKGFTLVELLAVIVVLGILLIIAIPTVINITGNAQRKAFAQVGNLAIEEAAKHYLEDLEKHGDELSNYPGTIAIYYDIKEDLKLGDGKIDGVVGYILTGYNKYSYSILMFNKDLIINKAYDDGVDDPNKSDVTLNNVQPMDDMSRSIISLANDSTKRKWFTANYQALTNSDCFYDDWDLFDGKTFNRIAHSDGNKTVRVESDGTAICTRPSEEYKINELIRQLS